MRTMFGERERERECVLYVSILLRKRVSRLKSLPIRGEAVRQVPGEMAIALSKVVISLERSRPEANHAFRTRSRLTIGLMYVCIRLAHIREQFRREIVAIFQRGDLPRPRNI